MVQLFLYIVFNDGHLSKFYRKIFGNLISIQMEFMSANIRIKFNPIQRIVLKSNEFQTLSFKSIVRLVNEPLDVLSNASF